jgi:hypothetical protein
MVFVTLLCLPLILLLRQPRRRTIVTDDATTIEIHA